MSDSHEWLTELDLNPTTKKAYDVYRRTADIYRRTTAALGREPKLKVTVATTHSVSLDGRRVSKP